MAQAAKAPARRIIVGSSAPKAKAEHQALASAPTATVVDLRTRRRPPWLHADGRPKTTEELKSEVSSWNAADWEGYLATIEHPRAEVLLDTASDIESLSNEDYARGFLDLFQKDERPRLAAHMRKILATLSPRQRNILTMRYVEGMTLATIGKILGVRVQTVETHLRRALRNFGEKLRRIGAAAV